VTNWRGRLREAVKRSGKKHLAIAWDADITPATLSRVLTGKHAHPGFETVMKIAHAVGESVGWLCGEEEFYLSEPQRAKLKAAAAILSDLTRPTRHNPP
jgi:transcriptional regulator with XRE-family HTH domain